MTAPGAREECRTRPVSGALVALDATAVGIVSAAISLASDDLVMMSTLVPTVVLAWLALAAALAPQHGVDMRVELPFFLLCTALGAWNDWNSVCRHGIYDYTVPHEVVWSTVPLWMLLYWGLVLRFVARIAGWKALGPDPEPSNRLRIGRFRIDSAAAKVLAEIGLVLATRRMIYVHFHDPVLSWLPFLLALAAFFVFFAPTRHDWKLVVLALVAGPAVEILYIRVGGLHRYHLGWLGGVPFWIVLWWALAVLVWKDLSFRIERGMTALVGRLRPA